MRILLTSDIHANLVALEAALADAGEIDGVWNMGDAVGYGPQPSDVIARLREVAAVWVAGNHERAVTGAMSTAGFNPQAAAAADWTAAQLSPDEKTFLDALPEVTEQLGFTLCHGTLRNPVWEYLYDYDAARAHLSLQHSPFGCVGHTHVPALVTEDASLPEGCDMRRLKDGETVQLGEQRLVFNPGSVGQPRDGDPRAAYAILDTDEHTYTQHRVEYAVQDTQELMEDAGLPAWLIERLEIGR